MKDSRGAMLVEPPTLAVDPCTNASSLCSVAFANWGTEGWLAKTHRM